MSGFCAQEELDIDEPSTAQTLVSPRPLGRFRVGFGRHGSVVSQELTADGVLWMAVATRSGHRYRQMLDSKKFVRVVKA